MERLSVEEKARAYDDAIERANELNYVSDKDSLQRKTVEHIFPELKESKDEKTWIINYLSNRILNSTIIAEKENLKKAIAWVEKQGEKDEEILILKDQIESLHAAIKAIKEIHKIELEKQGEQKPAWSEEDEKILSDIIKDLVHPWNEYIPDRIEDEIKWLKNKLKSLTPQTTWKPSDEQMKALADALSLAKNCGEEIAFDLRTLYEQLKKLKEK
jgi:hypothetical protein